MGLNNTNYYPNGNTYRKNKNAINVEGVSFYNRTSRYKSGLACTLWNKMLKIAILRYDELTDTFSAGRSNDHACIFLGQTKAFLLSNILKKFKKDREKYNGYGVFTSKAVITILNGASFGGNVNDCAIRIVKFNNDMIIDNQGAYQFNTNYYQYANNMIAENNMVTFDRIDNEPELDDAELDLFIAQLDEFVKATTFSQAYATFECMNPSITTIKNSLNEMYPIGVGDSWRDIYE